MSGGSSPQYSCLILLLNTAHGRLSSQDPASPCASDEILQCTEAELRDKIQRIALGTLNVPVLKELCRKLGLPISCKRKDELVQRILEHLEREDAPQESRDQVPCGSQTTGADPGQDTTPKGGGGHPPRTPKWLHGTMCFVGARGAGDFVLGTRYGANFCFHHMC